MVMRNTEICSVATSLEEWGKELQSERASERDSIIFVLFMMHAAEWTYGICFSIFCIFHMSDILHKKKENI